MITTSIIPVPNGYVLCLHICILAEKRNASINSGVVFLKKIVDFI